MTKMYLAKPDLVYFAQYKEMMKEWKQDGSQIAPWFLNTPVETLEDFAKLVQMLDDCENGNLDKQYASTSSYFVTDKNGRLIGAASLRHHLTVEGLAAWGHIGYGIRPAERRKGYAVQVLSLLLEKAKAKNINMVLLGSYESNVGSCKTIEKCGGMLENTVTVEGESEPIRRYWINLL